ncbi:MAG: PIN domain-containing protein [Candidatus Babeliales bacterium]
MKPTRDKIFVDTNILIYFYTKTEKNKLLNLEKILIDSDLIISTQVLNELSNVLIKKFNLTSIEIVSIIKELSKWCFVYNIEITTIIYALHISQKYKFSYFDSLMLAAALENDCKIIFSEDMHHECIIEKTLHIFNPFK